MHIQTASGNNRIIWFDLHMSKNNNTGKTKTLFKLQKKLFQARYYLIYL